MAHLEFIYPKAMALLLYISSPGKAQGDMYAAGYGFPVYKSRWVWLCGI